MTRNPDWPRSIIIINVDRVSNDVIDGLNEWNDDELNI